LRAASDNSIVRIAFLCKRRYMSKDVIVDRYARLYEIPFQLAKLGHDVRGCCLGYGNADEGAWEHEAAPGILRWESRSLGRLKLPVLLGYPRHLLRRLREFRPDIVIGASDIPHVALGARLARRLRIPFVADLYDNFEGFGQARIPGFVSALRRAVRDADLVTTTSEPLRDFVIETYKARGKVIAMPSTIDKAAFHPRDRAECRRALALPATAKLIGTAGGLYADKGIGDLYAAWKLLEARDPDLHLVLAGPHEAALPPPQGDRVHWLGPLPHARVAELFCALDVGVMCIRDTPFGRYCFPQKAYEMLACGLPVVAADIGAMSALFAAARQHLYRSGDAGDLADRIERQLETPMASTLPIEDWAQLIGRIEPELRRLAGINPALAA
jgi:glycosyltransferase involved in cell wall biosynthesis